MDGNAVFLFKWPLPYKGALMSARLLQMQTEEEEGEEEVEEEREEEGEEEGEEEDTFLWEHRNSQRKDTFCQDSES